MEPSDKERRRIYGLEVEHGLIFTGDKRDSASEEFDVYPSLPKKIEDYFFQTLNSICKIRYNRHPYASEEKAQGAIKNFFSRNGGRIYLDVGQHPETSTPECLTLRDVVLYDKAAERLLEETLRQTNRYLKKKKRSSRSKGKPEKTPKVLLFKNNTHSGEETFGCHENYLVSRRIPFNEEIVPVLLPFLVTRQIFCGSGKIWGDRFEISQRAKFIQEKTSSMTNDSWGRNNQPRRSIIHCKDLEESDRGGVTLADGHLWQRIHLILGDSNMSEYASWLKLGTTALVLRMIEDRFLGLKLKIAAPIASYHKISQDLSCAEKIKVFLASGGRYSAAYLSAVEIQELYLKEAQKYLEGEKASFPLNNLKEFQEIVKEWEMVLGKLKTDPRLLSQDIDWVIKKKLLDDYRAERQLNWDDPTLKMIDAQYHLIDRQKGLYYLLTQEGKVRRILTEEEIKKSCFQPPNTRAKWRGALIEFAEKNKIYYGGDWNRIYFYPKGKQKIRSEIFERLNPFDANPPNLKNKSRTFRLDRIPFL